MQDKMAGLSRADLTISDVCRVVRQCVRIWLLIRHKQGKKNKNSNVHFQFKFYSNCLESKLNFSRTTET